MLPDNLLQMIKKKLNKQKYHKHNKQKYINEPQKPNQHPPNK